MRMNAFVAKRIFADLMADPNAKNCACPKNFCTLRRKYSPQLSINILPLSCSRRETPLLHYVYLANCVCSLLHTSTRPLRRPSTESPYGQQHLIPHSAVPSHAHHATLSFKEDPSLRLRFVEMTIPPLQIPHHRNLTSLFHQSQI
jgi:hypothetical protein